MNDTSADLENDNIVHTWDHPNASMVSFYNIVLDGDDQPGQVVQVNSTRVDIPRLPGLSYSGSLSAVSICGAESERITFAGIDMPCILYTYLELRTGIRILVKIVIGTYTNQSINTKIIITHLGN